jgi:hypothetical protein
MTQQPTSDTMACPACGAGVSADRTSCWLCGGPLAAAADGAAPRPAPAHAAAEVGWTFSLSTLMLIVTLVAVTLGIAGLEPVLGNSGLAILAAIVFAMVAAPAMLRTSLASARQRRAGQPMTFPQKLLVLAGSLGVMIATGVAACVAFCATCFGTLFGSAAFGAKGYDPQAWGLLLGAPLGILLAIVVIVLMLRWLWPRRKPRGDAGP